MKETVEVVQVALDKTEMAQSLAREAVETANRDTRSTLDLLVSVSLQDF